MSRHILPLPDLTIPNGTQPSNAILSTGPPTAPAMATTGFGFRDADAVTIYAPATLPETVTVQVADSESGQVWRALQSSGADVTIAAGKAVEISPISFGSIRLNAGVNVAADRTFKVTKSVLV